MGCRLGLDLALLWLRCRPGTTAANQPLAWGLPYAVGAPLKDNLKKKKERRDRKVPTSQGTQDVLTQDEEGPQMLRLSKAEVGRRRRVLGSQTRPPGKDLVKADCSVCIKESGSWSRPPGPLEAKVRKGICIFQ